jgi:hypothetical protein
MLRSIAGPMLHVNTFCVVVANGCFGGSDVQRHGTAKKIVGIEVAKHQIGIGHGELRPAASIACRPGFRPGTMRAILPPPAPTSNRSAHEVFTRPHAVETDEPSDPLDIGALGVYGVVMQTEHLADVIEQFGVLTLWRVRAYKVSVKALCHC